ncbi:MAG TPA: glycosyltransferase [Candidatus Binataceae bacterium]
MSIVHSLALAGIFISIWYYAATVAAAWRFKRRAAAGPRPLPKIVPRAALLKPLHGISDSLVDDLLSFMEVDYPRKEYLFGVASYEDPAAQIPLALKPRYQFAQISLTVGGDPSAANRKLGKLIRMVPRASRPDVFVLSDADIAVEPDYLRRVIGDLYADDRIGLVTCAYRARPPQPDLGARLEALYINTDFMPMAILADSFEPLHYAFGATIAIKSKVLEEIGGFEAIKDLLADDFHLGNRAVQRGYKIGLSSALVTIVPGERTFSDFWHHQLRWARTYRTVRPISLGTILTHGPFWASMLLMAAHFSLGSIAIAAAAVTARLAMGAMMISGVGKLPLSISDLGLLLFKDFCITGIWFASLVGKSVRWGDRHFKIAPGGRLEEIKSQPEVHSRNTAAPPQSVPTMAPSPMSDATPGSR